jgi:PIN domain nuclease of toxin-antitoxin system
MNVLLDTHIFLWLAMQPKNLSSAALTAIGNASVRYLSIASIWEMQIKSALNKLPITTPLPTLVEGMSKASHIQILPITQDHIYRLSELPHHHGDPFDRMLVVQAQHGGLSIITVDFRIKNYDVSVIG